MNIEFPTIVPAPGPAKLGIKDERPHHGTAIRREALVADGHANAFLGAAVLAWSEHYPLELSAGMIWFLVLQGIAKHVMLNAERVRANFVLHKDKQEIVIIDDSLRRFCTDNNWPSVFARFVAQIDAHTVPAVVPTLQCDFSTSSELEHIAGKVAIMDITQSFFTFVTRTRCGFPRVTLLGTKADWVLLDEKIDPALALCVPAFAKSWAEALHSVMHKFIAAWDGQVDEEFWQSMIKRGGAYGSGGYAFYSGWINVFFPYVHKDTPSHWCKPYPQLEQKHNGGPAMDGFPSSLCMAPVRWEYLGTNYPITFEAGLAGIEQDPGTLALRPVFGWRVADVLPPPPPPPPPIVQPRDEILAEQFGGPRYAYEQGMDEKRRRALAEERAEILRAAQSQ